MLAACGNLCVDVDIACQQPPGSGSVAHIQDEYLTGGAAHWVGVEVSTGTASCVIGYHCDCHEISCYVEVPASEGNGGSVNHLI